MESWSNLLSSDIQISELTIRLLVLTFVLSLEHFLTITPSYHPGSLWKFIAIKLANKSKHRQSQQQYISGIISTIILLSFALLITYAIISFATYPWFFEIIFLLLAVNSTPLLKICNNIYFSLYKGKKSLAREQLNTVCIRDTQTLSVMGIVKGTIEGTIQQFSLRYFTPIFIYLVGGVYALTFYGLIVSLAQYWSPKQKNYRSFGRFSNGIKDVMTIPFNVLLAVLVAILFGFKHLSVKLNSWHRFGTGVLLATTAFAMHRELGGAVMYDGIKIRRPKLGSNTAPVINDIKDLSRLIKRLRQSIMVITSFSTLFIVILS